MAKISAAGAAKYGKIAGRHGILGVADEAMGDIFATGLAGVSGAFSGLMNKPLSVANKGIVGGSLHAMGHGLGKSVNVASKPLRWGAKTLTKNTPAELSHMGSFFNDKMSGSGSGIRDFFFEHVGSDAGPNSIAGWRAKKRTSALVLGGAAAYGTAGAFSDTAYQHGMATAVNGATAMEGVSNAPGTINQNFSPGARPSIEDHGATGELPLALHHYRGGGYL